MKQLSDENVKLYKALKFIGKDSTLRTKFVNICKEVERTLVYQNNQSIRDDITGPILDALHSEVGILQKCLSSGVRLDFKYTSKISRDFVMSNPECPDHVWEPQTTKLLLYLSKNAKHVIVGGAYFGDHAILIADQIRSNDGICHAFEINVEQSELLRHNASVNNLENVKVWQKALWKDDMSQLCLIGEDAYASSIPLSEGKTPCKKEQQIFKTITIDTYLREQNIEQISLIMLDVEGAEYQVLQGARQQLERPADRAPNLVFEIHRHYTDWTNGLHNTEIIQYLTSFGYQVYAVRDFHSNYDMADRQIEIIPSEETYLEGPPHGFNMVAVKNSSILQNSLFKMCYRVSPKLLVHKDPSLHHPTGGI